MVVVASVEAVADLEVGPAVVDLGQLKLSGKDPS